jgi:hypothetical protein
VNDQERLAEVQAEIAAVSASILTLLGKTRQSVSFGDQSYGLADIDRLSKIRDLLRQREAAIESRMSGGTTHRRTIKISFPPC